MQRIQLIDLFNHYKKLPHQMAALTELEQQILAADPNALDRDRDWFKTWSQAGKQGDPAWLGHALGIIKEFEGCHLKAYLCPVGIPTVGWGNTSMDGRAVKLGDVITQAKADAMLQDDVLARHQELLKLMPAMKSWAPEQQAAVVSWAYNVGMGAVASSTLRTRINKGETPSLVVTQELPRWNRGTNGVLPGLARRRQAEVALFQRGTAAQYIPMPAKLSVSSPFSARITPNIRLGEFALDKEERRFVHQYQLDTAAELATFLERVRRNLGNKPIRITSGYRPAAINRQVGGASGSEHLFDAPGVGALDFYMEGVDIKQVQAFCDKYWDYSVGLGAVKGFVHLGIRKGRPRLRWPY